MNFKEIANSLVFDLNEDEIKSIETKYDYFGKNLDKIRTFNLENYKGKLEEYCSIKNGTLREDFNNVLLNNEDHFKNSISVEEGFIKVNNDK